MKSERVVSVAAILGIVVSAAIILSSFLLSIVPETSQSEHLAASSSSLDEEDDGDYESDDYSDADTDTYTQSDSDSYSDNLLSGESSESGTSSADGSDADSDDGSADDYADDSTEVITYPPYPGGISENEYWLYVADMTNEENEVQSIHEGMWQIADCLPRGTSTTGDLPLDEAIGILANNVDGQWVPDPENGLYCVTRQGTVTLDNGDISLGVESYDTFSRLTREQIDMEPSAKRQALYGQ